MAEDVLPGTRAEDGAGDSDNTGLIAAGVAALEAGRRDEAESAFRKVLAREPDNPSALRRLGVVVYMKGDYEDARGLLDMAIDLAPEDADAYNNLAAILLDRGELTDAEINFRRARELDPTDTDINFNLGLILLQRGNFVEARSCFEVVVAGRPDDADAHHNLGMAWRRESGKDAAAAAIASFRRAVEIDGDDCDSLLELAALLREEGCLTEALAVSERVLKTENIDARAHYNHGAILYDFGRYEDAVRSLRRAVAEDPPDLRAHDALGRALAAMGDMDGAIRAFRRGIEAQPDNHRIKRNLRDAYSRLVPSWHLPMINDSGRNEVYQAAIEKAVGADDIVLDIGTGSGLSAMMAARAGARRVIGCEMLGSMAEMARRIIARNGYEETITVLTKQSSELVVGEDLPEPASVLISENLDVTLIGESVIPSLRHATRHLVRPDAKVIPQAARIWGCVVEWPGERTINPVRKICDFDFSDFDLFRNPNMHVPFDEERDPHRALSAPFEIAAYDFRRPPDFSDGDIVEVLTLPALETGTAHAVTVWFELELDDEISFSTRFETNLNHWHQTAQFLDRDLAVQKGEEFHLTVRRTDTRFCFEAGRPETG
ncbi:MAG: tetratricopeptide repeat protein [Rhodospirillaceae bacterium]|nr:tetratricopeptide repeat protein [Rhodospirillaceae bacterium]